MDRERGIELVTQILERAAGASDKPLSFLTEIHVFGSFARGALNPRDIDLIADFTPDADYIQHMIDRRRRGLSESGEVKSALVGRKRGVQLMFMGAEHAALQGITPVVLLWQRGDALSTALERLHAIVPDPFAGRAPRDAMLPAFEGIDGLVPRMIREPLSRWVAAGAVSVSRVDLPEATVLDPWAKMEIERRWVASSPLRRAAHSALAFLESQGADFDEVYIDGRGSPSRQTRYVVGFGWRGMNVIQPMLMQADDAEWLEIPAPAMRHPLVAVRIKVADGAILALQKFST